MSEKDFLEGHEDNLESELEDSDDGDSGSSSVTRRKFLATAASPALMASLGGCVGPAEFNDYGEFEIGIRKKIFDPIPFTEYYSPALEKLGDTIHERAENEISGRNVAETNNKILMDLEYFSDERVLEWMQESPEVVGDPEAVTRLIGWGHYSIIRMGIKAGGAMKDIQQYLAKDLQQQYANNAAIPFHDALNITYDVANHRFDINEESDERDDQFIGMNLYMLGNGNSQAGRYFNTSEIERYADGSVENLQEALEEEAISEGGFDFTL